MIHLKREGFINQYPPLNVLNKEEVEQMFQKDEIHLYVHIPFCKAKCDFCYYLSFPIGNQSVPEEYMKALQTELELYSAMPEIQTKQIRTIYFGGGTPALLSEEQISALVQVIRQKFTVMENIEFCVEVGPELDTSKEKLQLLKNLGVNRISIGCQSTDDKILNKNGRYRSSANFYSSYERIKNTGFACINVDIMSGLIGQSSESFLKTIDDIIALQPQNISIYKLEVYLNNELYKKLRSGKIELSSDDLEIKQVKAGYERLLSQGYTLANHFSFYSNAAYDHVHRRELWNGADMLGIGLSSHSSVNGFLYQNESAMEVYYERLKNGKLPVKRGHKMTIQEKIAQKMILGLKNLNVNRHMFIEQFGLDPLEIYKDQLNILQGQGLAIIGDDYIRLTFDGSMYADDIVKEFYLPQHKSMSLAHALRV